VRLQKYLAHSGVASRRACEALIAHGRVRVNGRTVQTLGSTVDEGDRIEVDGVSVHLEIEHAYLAMHKPAGVMTTLRDPQGRATVKEFLPRDLPRVVPVGRLAYDTPGLLLLTNDGDLAHRLTHPSFGIENLYRAPVRGQRLPPAVAQIRRGVALRAGRAHGTAVRVIARRGAASVVDITLHEGRNREVRRIFEAIGHPVVDLRRMRFGPVRLGDLAAGQIRPLTARELRALRGAVLRPPVSSP